MNKTFKSAKSDIKLSVCSTPEGLVNVKIGTVSIHLEPDVIPELSLAILEAAGYTEDDTEIGPRKNLVATDYSLGMRYLRFGIEEQLRKSQANKEAEAKDKAELEAEALELYKAHTGYTHAKSLSEAAAPDRWLAVARRAREMRAEK